MSDAVPAKRKLGDFLPSFAATLGGGSPYARALKEGLLAGAILFALLVVWMTLRANDTAQSLQPLVPFKTTVIEEPAVKVTPQDPNAPATGLNNARNIKALPPAPIEGLTESHDGMILPLARITDDLTPFDAYKKPFTPIAGKGLVSIVVVDFGLAEKISTSMLDNMPPEISLVISPYTADLPQWASAARAYGHEFWLSLPMQTNGESDTGPESLLTNASLEENQARVLKVLGSAVGYTGLVTEKDHVLKSDDMGAAPILKQIFGRGLALAESNPEIAAYGLSLAMQDGHPYVQNNFWIDADLRPDAIDAALREVELQASRKGKAIAFLHPYPAVVQKVKEWTDTAGEKGIQLAPLSAMTQ